MRLSTFFSTNQYGSVDIHDKFLLVHQLTIHSLSLSLFVTNMSFELCPMEKGLIQLDKVKYHLSKVHFLHLIFVVKYAIEVYMYR
jgi:hypothetical protein